MTPTQSFARAREVLLRHRDDQAKAATKLRWPELDDFNWASDGFDALASYPVGHLSTMYRPAATTAPATKRGPMRRGRLPLRRTR